MTLYFQHAVSDPTGRQWAVIWVGCKGCIIDDFCCFFDGLDDGVRDEDLGQQFLCEARIAVFVRFFKTPWGKFVPLDLVLLIGTNIRITKKFLVRYELMVKWVESDGCFWAVELVEGL